MIHEFANNYVIWYNTYSVEGMVAIPYADGPVLPILDIQDPQNQQICFKISYTGISVAYSGEIVTDGVRYAYIVDNRMISWLIEPKLNLYCRSKIRQAVREFLDSMEMWPL